MERVDLSLYLTDIDLAEAAVFVPATECLLPKELDAESVRAGAIAAACWLAGGAVGSWGADEAEASDNHVDCFSGGDDNFFARLRQMHRAGYEWMIRHGGLTHDESKTLH